MANLTVVKTVTYGTGYDITGTVVVPASISYRDLFILDPSTPTLIFQNDERPVATGDVKYLMIENTGANSAYIAMEDTNGAAMMHEIPAGTVWDSFGEDIMGNGADWPTPETINAIYAKGNTTIKFDAFF